MSGILYVVGTPIGNLSDFSPRAIQTLKEVDFIAAEDTRVTIKLLNRFEIQKPMISYYAHNFIERGPQIIDRLIVGENGAIVTDAGMPCISDPGEDLVKLAINHGIEVRSVPGPTAAMTALSISGQNTNRFSFEGFLSTNVNARKKHLEEIQHLPQTLIFYEAPHKLRRTLEDFLIYLGDRSISLCRELTKLHEEVIKTTISKALSLYTEKDPKGEFVLVLEGYQKPAEEKLTLVEAINQIQNLLEKGIPLKDASKLIAKESSFSKSELYKAVLEQNENEE